jgi:hypothetical protein
MRNWIDIMESQQPVSTVLYHGSHAEFDSFEHGHRNGWSKPRRGFYFTDDLAVVEEFFGKAMAFHVTMNHPADFEFGEGAEIVYAAIEHNPALMQYRDAAEERFGADESGRRITHHFASMGFLQTDDFITTLEDMGYDGMIFGDVMSGTPFTSYVAFNADQIKKA